MTEKETKLPQPDLQLITRCKKGESEAFRYVVDMYQHYVRNLIFKIILNDEHTKDIAQNAFIKIWQNINKYDEKYLFSTWMYRIVVNNCYDFLKSQKYRKHIKLNHSHNNGYSEHEESYSNKNLIKQIRIISRELPAKQRMVFVLKDLQDLSIQEVAEILRMNNGTVKSNLYYARKHIKKVLLKWEKLEEQS